MPKEKPPVENPNRGKHGTHYRRNPRTSRAVSLTSADIARIAAEDSRARVVVTSRGIPKLAIYFRPVSPAE